MAQWGTRIDIPYSSTSASYPAAASAHVAYRKTLTKLCIDNYTDGDMDITVYGAEASPITTHFIPAFTAKILDEADIQSSVSFKRTSGSVPTQGNIFVSLLYRDSI